MFRIRNRSLFNLGLCLPVYMPRFSPHTSVASLLISWLFLQTNSMECVLSFGYYPLLHLNVFSSFVPLVLEYICASCADRFPHRGELYGRAFVWSLLLWQCSLWLGRTFSPPVYLVRCGHQISDSAPLSLIQTDPGVLCLHPDGMLEMSVFFKCSGSESLLPFRRAQFPQKWS